MKKYFLYLLCLVLLPLPSHASWCKKSDRINIKFDESWHKKEALRLVFEELLLAQYPNHITKETKPLKAETYHCFDGETCDKLKNCQMEKDPKNLSEGEYRITTEAGVVIAKSHCSIIGKCIGYNDFTHDKNVTAAEDRLIDIKQGNAVFYHYFFAQNSQNYEAPFNITNLHSGKELYLNDEPHFSPDEKVMIEIRSIPISENSGAFPTGFNINIYELDASNHYQNVEPVEVDAENPAKILSTFLSRNPACGETPHFHSWKNNREIRLSMLPPHQANQGKRVILAYDDKTKKWLCHEDFFPEFECKSNLPDSTKFSSNLAKEQLSDCN